MTTDGVVGVGSLVRIRDVDGEAEFAIGRCLGDEVRFRAPGGALAVTVVGVGPRPGGSRR